MKVVKTLNSEELFYNIVELKKLEENFEQKNYYDSIYNILQEQLNLDFDSIFEAVEKNYIILNIDPKISNNINEHFFYNYVYTYNNGKITKVVGNVKYKNFIFTPLLNHYNQYIFEITLGKSTKNLINKFNIKNVIESIPPFNKNIDPSTIIEYIYFINQLSYQKFIINDKPVLKIEMDLIAKNFGFNKQTFNTNFKSLTENYILNKYYQINNVIVIRDALYLFIIRRYFSSKDLKIFLKNYNIYKNIKKSLSDKDYESVEKLYISENKRLEEIENNTCEHVKLLKDNDIKTIIDLYININSDNENNFYICKKCKLPPNNMFS